MMDEVFRFTILRAPQRKSSRSTTAPVVAAYPEKLSAFADEMAKLAPKDAATRASTYIASVAHVSSLDSLKSPLATFDRALLPPPSLDDINLPAVLESVFGIPAAKILASGEYRESRTRLADSLLAASATTTASARGQECLVRGLRLCGAIEILAASGSDVAAKAALQAKVILPRRKAPAAAAVTTSKTAGEAQKRAQQRAEVASIRAATTELKRVWRHKQMSIAAQGLTAEQRAKLPSTDRLAKGEFALLSSPTRTLLQKYSLPQDGLYLPATIEHLDLTINFEIGALQWLLPFYPMFPASIPATTGRARVAGVSDLLFVRQRVKRYEIGEIAHIENALRGESFARVFKRTDSSEIVELEETEKAEAIERDLQSTSKSELKAEAERTIEEDLKFDAGVTVTASGPGIEVGANAGFAYERSSEDSAKTATTFARDVIDRSVSKLSERTLKRRSTRATRQVEETSEHKLDNSAASEHLAGVYRWVDKIYEAQVVNYGKRLILEFVLVEPAAFHRLARTHRPLPGVMAQLPDPPTFADATTGEKRELRVEDVDAGNYLQWVSEFAVPGINPPPPEVTYIGTALESGPKTPPADSVSKVLVSGSLKVPAGYRAREIRMDWAGEHDAEPWYWELIVGTESFVGASGGAPLESTRTLGDTSDFDGDIPVSLVVKNIGSFTVNVVIRCEQTQSGREAWKLATFNSIMSRYMRLKADYEDQVAAAQVQQGVAVFASNPATNREIERNELRRQSIAVITGQNFDLFNAMSEATDSSAYPQVNDFGEAQREGNYIQFFEQALEWRYMSYVFYPYFWGRKPLWPEVLNESADDPLFAQFLRAGAARVQVPVRPGFEDAMGFFLRTGKVWFGGEPPHFEDAPEEGAPPFMPLFQELQEQSGLEFVDGAGSVSVSAGSVTVTGTGTTFAGPLGEDLVANADREIRIAGRDYRIRRVVSATELTLASAYAGADAADLPYALGPKLVGQPWDVKLPTQLVILQGKESELNYAAPTV